MNMCSVGDKKTGLTAERTFSKSKLSTIHKWFKSWLTLCGHCRRYEHSTFCIELHIAKEI